VIHRIEHFGPELKRNAFTETEALEHGTIDVHQARCRENVSASIAECASRRKHEGLRIEPLVRRAFNDGAGEIRVQGDAVRVSRVAVGGLIESDQRRERETGLSGDDGVDLPPAQNRIGETFGAAEKSLTVPNRQRIAEVTGDATGDVEVRRPPILCGSKGSR